VNVSNRDIDAFFLMCFVRYNKTDSIFAHLIQATLASDSDVLIVLFYVVFCLYLIVDANALLDKHTIQLSRIIKCYNEHDLEHELVTWALNKLD
jgi:hypothetical protein